MLKIIKRLWPLSKEGEINRLHAELDAERQHSADLEDALCEQDAAAEERFSELEEALCELDVEREELE